MFQLMKRKSMAGVPVLGGGTGLGHADERGRLVLGDVDVLRVIEYDGRHDAPMVGYPDVGDRADDDLPGQPVYGAAPVARHLVRELEPVDQQLARRQQVELAVCARSLPVSRSAASLPPPPHPHRLAPI